MCRKLTAAPKLAHLIDKDVLAAMPKSKAEAKKAGVSQYYDGVVCVNGHDAIRSIACKRCMECSDIARAKRLSKSDKAASKKIVCFGQAMVLLSSAVF